MSEYYPTSKTCRESWSFLLPDPTTRPGGTGAALRGLVQPRAGVERILCFSSAQPCSCKTSPPPTTPQRHKFSPSQHGNETASTCNIASSDHLCHRSAARCNALISNAWEPGTD